MPLDPSIILQGRGPQLPDAQGLLTLKRLGTANQEADVSLGQAQRAAASQRTLADLYRQNTDANGNVNNAAISKGLADAGYGDQIPAVQQQAQATQAGDLKNQGAQLQVHKQKLDIVNNAMSSLLAQPNVTHDQVIGAISNLVDQGVIDAQQGAQMVRTLPGPNQLRSFLISKAIETMDASQKIGLMLPKYDEQDRGGSINQGTIDPLTGQRTAGADVAKTMTPGEKATQQRFQMGGLTTSAIDLAAQRILNGEPSSKVLANFGRGAQGARDIALVQNRVAEIAQANGYSPQDIATKTQELAAEGRSRIVLGDREGKIAPRVQEAINFANIAKQASAAVPRGTFMPWNKLSQMADTQMGDPNLAKMKAATLSLINAYAAAVGGGSPTVHDKEEASRILSTAQSPEAYAAVVDQLITESQAALESPRTVMEDMRRHSTGNGAKPTTQSGATVSNW